MTSTDIRILATRALLRFVDLDIKVGRIGVHACSMTVKQLSNLLSDRKSHTSGASAVQARTPILPVFAPNQKCALATLDEERDGGGGVAGQDQERTLVAGEEGEAEVKGG
jgi:hypothetical protein